VWCIVGPRGIGTTLIVSRIAASAALAGRQVLLANEHLSYRELRRRVRVTTSPDQGAGMLGERPDEAEASTVGVDGLPLTLAPFLPATESNPQTGETVWWSNLSDYDLVVWDSPWDGKNLGALRDSDGREAWAWRRAARAWRTPFIITARLPQLAQSYGDVLTAWEAHPRRPEVMEVCDVVVVLTGGDPLHEVQANVVGNRRGGTPAVRFLRTGARMSPISDSGLWYSGPPQ